MGEDVTLVNPAYETALELKGLLQELNLLRPIYARTVNYGHFTKPDLPWEQTDRTDALKAAL